MKKIKSNYQGRILGCIAEKEDYKQLKKLLKSSKVTVWALQADGFIKMMTCNHEHWFQYHIFAWRTKVLCNWQTVSTLLRKPPFLFSDVGSRGIIFFFMKDVLENLKWDFNERRWQD